MTTPEEAAVAMDAHLKSLETMGTTAMVDLNTATTRAQQILSDIEARVALNQMGAELVPLLTNSIQEAKQTHTDIQTAVTDVQEQQAVLAATVVEMQEAAAIIEAGPIEIAPEA